MSLNIIFSKPKKASEKKANWWAKKFGMKI
jgi:hypothetical protein